MVTGISLLRIIGLFILEYLCYKTLSSNLSCAVLCLAAFVPFQNTDQKIHYYYINEFNWIKVKHNVNLQICL
jgi:hypothetical protein